MPQKGLSRDAIKYIAMLTMLLNHISTVFMQPGHLLSELFLDIGYFTAITMCYFLVEGYRYTRSKKRYALRLGIFALLSEIPYCLAMTEGGILEFCGMNMLFTLLLCFCVLLVLDKVQNRAFKVLLIAGLTALSLFSDWALLAPVFTLLFAWSTGSKGKTEAAFGLSALLFGLMSYAGGIGRFSAGVNLLYAAGCMAGILLAGIVIVFFYNGKRAERGRNFSKWFFYLFYPVHLLVLGIIRIALL